MVGKESSTPLIIKGNPANSGSLGKWPFKWYVWLFVCVVLYIVYLLMLSMVVCCFYFQLCFDVLFFMSGSVSVLSERQQECLMCTQTCSLFSSNISALSNTVSCREKCASKMMQGWLCLVVEVSLMLCYRIFWLVVNNDCVILIGCH